MTGCPATVDGAGPDLDRDLIRGIAWTGSVRWASQLLTWLSTVVVARLLAPADYGLVGMAAVYLGLVLLVNDFGLGAAIVQQRNMDDERVARLGGLSLLLGTGFFAASVVVSGWLATFFDEPALRWIVIIASAGFIASALQVIPRALLARRLQFRRLALADGVEALSAAAVTLAMASLGFGYWSLVFGPLTSRALGAALLIAWRPFRVAMPWPPHTIRSATTFGGHLVGARLAWYVYSNADFAVVGRMLGKAALGTYTLGWTIASIPVDRISALVGTVTPPVLAAVQDNKPALQRYLRNLTEGLSLLTFPIAVGLALVADEMVPLIFGEHWGPAVGPLRVLALASAIRSITPLLPQVAIAMGDTRRNMQITLLASIILPLLFVLGSRWGTTGVALMWLVGHPLLVFPLFLAHTLRLTGMRLGSYLSSLWPATWLTGAMALAVVSVRAFTPADWPAVAQICLHVLAGAAAYALLVWAAYGTRAKALYMLVRGVKQPTAAMPVA